MSKIIYLGVKGSVVAIDSATGQPVWSTSLKGAEFVNVVLDGNNLFATTRGEIFCLDPQGGGIRWHNPLKGYGLGLITIAGEGIGQNMPAVTAEKRRRDQEQAAAAASSSSVTGAGA
jgi:outer membrane protein assembly factor BamB